MTFDKLTRIAVVDDVADDRRVLTAIVNRLRLEPVVLSEFSSLDDAVRQVQSNADALLCDHRLRFGGLGTFDGAELVARCFRLGIPSVLVTAYMQDSDVSIRLHRHDVSQLLARGELTVESVRHALDGCIDELAGLPPRDRKGRHAILVVTDTRQLDGTTVVDALIPQWDPIRVVTLPLQLLDGAEDVAPEQLVGSQFFADINIGADSTHDLYFIATQPAGDPPEMSELV